MSLDAHLLHRIRYGRLEAFTFLELMISLSVVAILVALSIGAYSKLSKRAEITKCMTNMQHVWSRLQIYAQENNGQLPPPTSSDQKSWWLVLGQIENPNYNTRKKEDNDLYNCPAAKRTYPNGEALRTYGMNAQNIITFDAMVWMRSANPSETLFVIETKSKGSVDGYPYFRWNSNPRFKDWVDPRHDGKFVGLFLDGHIELLSTTDPNIETYIRNYGQ